MLLAPPLMSCIVRICAKTLSQSHRSESPEPAPGTVQFLAIEYPALTKRAVNAPGHLPQGHPAIYHSYPQVHQFADRMIANGVGPSGKRARLGSCVRRRRGAQGAGRLPTKRRVAGL